MSDTSDHREDDFERGLRRRREVLGEAWVRRATEGATDFNADFQSLITRFAWDAVWNRPGLPTETRRLLVLATTAALGRWEEFELHTRAALAGGVSPELIQETLLQTAVYAGVPAANTGFKIARQLLDELGLTPAAAPLTPAARRRAFDTFSQPSLHVVLQGEGPRVPLVFAHALGLDHSLWDGLAAHCAAAGYPTLRYDQRGHGRSPGSPPGFSLDDLADDAARLIREWGRGPVVFVGLSLGGMVGQGLALRHPDLVRGLVLANTTGQYAPASRAVLDERIRRVRAAGMESVVDGVLERFLSPGARAQRPAEVEQLRRRLLANRSEAYAAMCEAVRGVDYLPRLKALQVPGLVIAGALDASTPTADGAALAEALGAAFETLEGVAHLSVVEQPERFAALLDTFCAGLASL